TVIDNQLQLLAELLVPVDCRDVDIGRRQGVEVDRRRTAVLAVSGDRTQLEALGQVDFAVQRDTAAFHFLLGIDKGALAVEYVREHRRSAQQAGDQPVPATRIALVPCVIAREADEYGG